MWIESYKKRIHLFSLFFAMLLKTVGVQSCVMHDYFFFLCVLLAYGDNELT